MSFEALGAEDETWEGKASRERKLQEKTETSKWGFQSDFIILLN